MNYSSILCVDIERVRHVVRKFSTESTFASRREKATVLQSVGVRDTDRKGDDSMTSNRTQQVQVQENGTDHNEFEKLVERTQRQAYNVAYRLTGNRDDAEDLTQEAYLRAYRSFGTYNRQLPFEGWFFRILSNLFIDLLRRRPKQKPLSLDHPMGDEESEQNLLLQIPDEQRTRSAI